MKKALIISGGDYCPLPENIDFDIVIACDRGYIYAERMGLTPNLIIGDFDSSHRPSGYSIPIITFPVEKDDTDTMLAVKYALDHGYDEIILVSALGKRMDHTLANIQTMHYVASMGGKCEIISDTEYMRTLSGGTLVLPKKENHSLSLFSLSAVCKGLTVSGAKYNVAAIELNSSFPLGVSNSWENDYVTISLDEGILLIIESDLSKE